MVINFINHAGFFFEYEDIRLLVDPWLDGTAFNDGWALISKSHHSIHDLAKATHIWISHEHPDHFRPGLLAQLPAERRKQISFLFQKTTDKKVIKFCDDLGFRTKELGDDARIPLTDNVVVTSGKSSIYDSWLLIETPSTKILNLNDSPVRSQSSISSLRKRVGDIDVLMTQFNFAGWHGNREDTINRVQGARRKLDTMQLQIEGLAPRYCVPFASFSYFCHVDNFFMNEESNSPKVAVDRIRQTSAIPVLLYPGDSWTVNSSIDNNSALHRYQTDYEHIGQQESLARESLQLPVLQNLAEKYRRRKLAQNSRFFIFLLQLIPFLYFLRPIQIHLSDLEITVSFSFTKAQALRPVLTQRSRYTLSMHTDSFGFLLSNDWGVDTLAANGRFRADRSGLWRLMATFGIGTLNNAGLYLNWTLFKNFSSIRFLVITALRKISFS